MRDIIDKESSSSDGIVYIHKDKLRKSRKSWASWAAMCQKQPLPLPVLINNSSSLMSNFNFTVSYPELLGNYTETVKEEGGGDGKIGGNMAVGRIEHLEHHALPLLIYT